MSSGNGFLFRPARPPARLRSLPRISAGAPRPPSKTVFTVFCGVIQKTNYSFGFTPVEPRLFPLRFSSFIVRQAFRTLLYFRDMVSCHILDMVLCHTCSRGDAAVTQKSNKIKPGNRNTEDEFQGNLRNIVVTDRLQALRKLRKKTQVYMSDALLMGQGDYSKAERGLRAFTPFQIQQMALILDTSMDYLCGLTDEIRPYVRSEKP